MNRLVFDIDESELPFVAYVPDDTTKKLPVIVQLHGAGERGCGGDDLDAVEIYGFTKLFSEEEQECILILPQCPPDSFWVAEIQKLHTFISNLKNNFNIDEDRIYLTGLSMGGFGTWYTAMAYPDTFAAIAPVCGGGMMWNAGVLNMPIWAFHGSEDNTVLPSETLNMVRALRSCGKTDVKFTIFDGVGHDSWVKAYNKELLDWLLSKRK